MGDYEQAMNAEIQFTVILDDPLANSYIQNPYAPDEDPKMTIEYYKRDFRQDEGKSAVSSAILLISVCRVGLERYQS